MNLRSLQQQSKSVPPIFLIKAEAGPFPPEGNLKEQLSHSWNLESIGVLPVESSVQDKFEETAKFSGKRYEVQLPWKESHSMLPDNCDLCFNFLTRFLKYC